MKAFMIFVLLKVTNLKKHRVKEFLLCELVVYLNYGGCDVCSSRLTFYDFGFYVFFGGEFKNAG